RLFGACADYPAGTPGPAERLTFLHAHQVDVGAFYANTIGRTVEQIVQEGQLREALQTFLDRARPDLVGLGALDVRNEVRRYIMREPSLQWARRPVPTPDLLYRLRETAHLLSL